MRFESLANETILDLFEYISLSDLFHGFYDLNSRFRQLLYVQFQKSNLDLRFLSKIKCDYLCEYLVPLFLDRIISLYLSNDDNTPQQIEYFLSYPYQLRQLIHLQSISLSHIVSPETLEQILIECAYLPYLTHLSIHNKELSMDGDHAHRFFDYIWRLENLVFCYLDIWFYFSNSIPKPAAISTSLRHFVSQRTSCTASTLAHLNQHTPNLEHLSITFKSKTDEMELMMPFQSLTRLKMYFPGSIKMLVHLLQHMPNLNHLTLEIAEIFINGYQWEEIIRTYLPELKTFRLIMNLIPSMDEDREDQLNRTIDTYRTKFWIDEHRWFVRCYWCNSSDHLPELITLSSSPYHFPINSLCIQAKSTSPLNDEYLAFNHVTKLCYKHSNFTDWMVSNVRLSSIQDLELPLPFKEQFLPVVTNFGKLRSLTVYVETSEHWSLISSQLQYMLDRAPRLRVLAFGDWKTAGLSVPPIGFTSVSVRHLILRRITYDNHQCMELSRSPLGRQCQTLSITVKYRSSILQLINSMPHLQALVVKCKEKVYPFENRNANNVAEYLRKELPSTCIIHQSRYCIYDVRIWIR